MDGLPLDLPSNMYLLNGLSKEDQVPKVVVNKANPCGTNLKSQLAMKMKSSYVMVSQNDLQSGAYCVNNSTATTSTTTTAPQDEPIDSRPLNKFEIRKKDLEMQAVSKQTRNKVKTTNPMPIYFEHDIRTNDYTFMNADFDVLFYATPECVEVFQRGIDGETNKRTIPATAETYDWPDFSDAITILIVKYRLVLIANYPYGLPLYLKRSLAADICKTFPSIGKRYIQLRNIYANVTIDEDKGITPSTFSKQCPVEFVVTRLSTQFKNNSKQPTINYGVKRKNAERKKIKSVSNDKNNVQCPPLPLPLPTSEQTAECIDICNENADDYSHDSLDATQIDGEHMFESPKQMQTNDMDIETLCQASALVKSSLTTKASTMAQNKPLTTTIDLASSHDLHLEASLDRSSPSTPHSRTTTTSTIVDYPSSDDDDDLSSSSSLKSPKRDVLSSTPTISSFKSPQCDDLISTPTIASRKLPKRGVLCSIPISPIENSTRQSDRIKRKSIQCKTDDEDESVKPSQKRSRGKKSSKKQI